MLTPEVHNLAILAARKATSSYLKERGDVGASGFAWVYATVKGNTKIGKSFISQGFTPDGSGGCRFDNPSGMFIQNVDAKHAGSKAYVAVLKKYYPDLWIQSVSMMH